MHSTNLISQEALAQLIPQFQAALGKSEDANMVINYAPTTSESSFGDAIFYLSTR